MAHIIPSILSNTNKKGPELTEPLDFLKILLFFDSQSVSEGN